MPKKMMMGEDAEADSLYNGGEPKPDAKESVDQEEAQDDNTALVPMKVLQGSTPRPIKEGEEIVVKAVKVYGDEVEIAYSKTPPSEIGKGDDYGAGAEIDKLDSEGGNPSY